MRLIIRHSDGSLEPAILLARMGTRIRASLPSCEDAVEFRPARGRWLAENGDVVQIEFDVPDREFHALVQRTANACEDPSDALEVHLWSICLPPMAAAMWVN